MSQDVREVCLQRHLLPAPPTCWQNYLCVFMGHLEQAPPTWWQHYLSVLLRGTCCQPLPRDGKII